MYTKLPKKHLDVGFSLDSAENSLFIESAVAEKVWDFEGKPAQADSVIDKLFELANFSVEFEPESGKIQNLMYLFFNI